MASTFSAWRPALLMLALSQAVPETAWACMVAPMRNASPAERRQAARQDIEQASAIVDGEVVRPYIYGRQSALVRAFRVLKGPHRAFFEVGERHSCDAPYVWIGERVRLVLVGGPALYFAPYTFAVESHIDRLLRSDRRRDWPYRAGTGQPAE